MCNRQDLNLAKSTLFYIGFASLQYKVLTSALFKTPKAYNIKT